MTRTMKDVARKRICVQCFRQNALGKAAVGSDGMWWRTCRYCKTKVWAGK